MSFKNGMKNTGGIWFNQIASTINSTSAKNKFPIGAALTRFRRWAGERMFDNLTRYAYELKNETFEKSVAVSVNDFQDDQYEGYATVFEDIGYQAAQWPQDLVLGAIQNGKVAKCFDGLPFFSASHLVDPADASYGTYQNLFTTTALTSGNFDTVMQKMKTNAGRDGRVMGFGANSQILLIVPPQLGVTARGIVEAQKNASGADNVLAGMAKVLEVPDLGVGGGANATTWYLADVGRPLKPIIFQNRQMPELVPPSATDESVKLRDEYQWLGKARGAAGYGLPFLMARAEA